MLWRLALAAAMAAALLDHTTDCELASDVDNCDSAADVFGAVTLTACRVPATSVFGTAVLLDDSLDSAETNNELWPQQHTKRPTPQ